MKLAIIGGRDFRDIKLFNDGIGYYNITDITHVVSGGAKGADSFGESWAKRNGIKTIIHLPDWRTYGNSAGFIRNDLIIKDCDEVLAFWDGASKGTMSSIKLAKRYEKPIRTIYYSNIIGIF